MANRVSLMAPYRFPRLEGLTVLVRGSRLELAPGEAFELAEALYWAHATDKPAKVAGMCLGTKRGCGVHIEMPDGACGILPRKVVLTWVDVLRERADRHHFHATEMKRCP